MKYIDIRRSNMNELLVLFLIMSIGYVLGSINFFGIKFGASAVLITALVFGHFGFTVPAFLSKIGIVLFLAPIGLMAGPTFIANIKKNGVAFLTLSFITCLAGGIIIILAVKIFQIPVALSLGLATGAMTSTAMLGTVNSLTDSALPGIGYGIAYTFVVIGVVMTVQIIPRLLKADRDAENAKLVIPTGKSAKVKIIPENLITIERNGLFSLALAALLGILLGSIKIPIGESVKLSLGAGGGSLIAGLFLGHHGNFGRINLKVSDTSLSLIRDLGLAFFLLQSGLKAGSGFVEVISTHGVKLFFIGVLMTMVPTLICFFTSYKFFKLPLFAALGSTTGSMTSAPSLGALLTVTEDNKVSAFYAATQPTATVMMVFLPQLVNLFLPVS
ncbi:AspT/YidE/YbjL antiporter duplication domain protein [Treponema phagedenis F0421]|nr:AspT/YidE/YbjL antiporter duplication domain protein [Treponema phagedenis F0421]